MINKDRFCAAQVAAGFIKNYHHREGAFAARSAADVIKNHQLYPERFERPIGLVLGTGWGDCLPIDGAFTIPLKEIPGFEHLGELEGHKRELIICQIAGRNVFILNGRIHLNESPGSRRNFAMVRLQVEMLFQLGVKELIATNAAGSLTQSGGDIFEVGDIAVISSFITLFGPQMPLWAGEFCSPEDALSHRLVEIALDYRDHQNNDLSDLTLSEATYAMVLGPHFEGRKNDKRILANFGADVVGMSTVPEACIANLYGVEFLGLSFVTNNDKEEHSHQENTKRVKKASAELGLFLKHIIKSM